MGTLSECYLSHRARWPAGAGPAGEALATGLDRSDGAGEGRVAGI
jgi:hypothetical protein